MKALKKVLETLVQGFDDVLLAVTRTIALIATNWRAYDFKALLGVVGVVVSVLVELEAQKEILPPGLHEMLAPLTPYVPVFMIVSGIVAASGKSLLVSKPNDEGAP